MEALKATFDPAYWARVPFWFWGCVMFWLGSCVGSFLNVCIYRMPLGLSVVSPPSHCPHCKYSIPWYLNVPLLTWLSLRGKCKNCGAPISVRYFLVELLTAVMFVACWLKFGHATPGLAVIYAFFIAGLITATFIDFEHFIIPDEITIGGIFVGFACSVAFPALHHEKLITGGIMQSILGIVVGSGVIYAILRAGKLLFGRQLLAFPAKSKLVFTETSIHLPDKEIPYEELFYRESDAVIMHADTVELVDRAYKDVRVRLALLANKLQIGDEEINPEDCHHMEIVTSEVVLPREAMGLGDVKFMAAIGAFLGWKSTIFTLMLSSMIGAVVGIALIVIGKREWSSRLPYGPYIALAAVVWLFAGEWLMQRFFPSLM